MRLRTRIACWILPHGSLIVKDPDGNSAVSDNKSVSGMLMAIVAEALLIHAGGFKEEDEQDE